MQRPPTSGHSNYCHFVYFFFVHLCSSLLVSRNLHLASFCQHIVQFLKTEHSVTNENCQKSRLIFPFHPFPVESDPMESALSDSFPSRVIYFILFCLLLLIFLFLSPRSLWIHPLNPSHASQPPGPSFSFHIISVSSFSFSNFFFCHIPSSIWPKGDPDQVSCSRRRRLLV